ncbi:EamA family transporter [Candidatus Pseudothioglobus sp. Uisw_086]|uniref:EamA family transporter n=1 Tax=Candidatus Pseudothioglobus sp. Uisw_086 TaxID=3230998 RepID=UPI003A86C214
MQFIFNHFYLLLAISFGVVSQLIVKWQMSAFSFDDYETWQDKFVLAFSMLLNPYIILSLILTFLAGVTWMIVMTKFEISYAYPFTLLGLVFVTIFSIVFFGENFNLYKIGGIVLILFGVFLISKGLK